MKLAFVTFAFSLTISTASLLALAASLMLLNKFSRAASDFIARAPVLDLVVAAFTFIPWVVAGVLGGWVGAAGTLGGQLLTLYAWCFGHEMTHPGPRRGPRINKFINRMVGRWRNHVALLVTLVALPGFWFIRIVQIVAYWPLVVLLGFPRYRHGEWVNVSRQKFDGLIGHDLVWCLYCDWMTGVYALGAEMLRNVESFWCPIRFYDGKKCANCRTDFPDLDHGWVPADATMREVEQLLYEKYGAGQRTWFGHPARLTVKGKPIEAYAAM
jgi:hypothetical protein